MELSFDYKFDNEENVDENGYYIQNNVYICILIPIVL